MQGTLQGGKLRGGGTLDMKTVGPHALKKHSCVEANNSGITLFTSIYTSAL